VETGRGGVVMDVVHVKSDGLQLMGGAVVLVTVQGEVMYSDRLKKYTGR
jgi:hypothetical protein